MPRVPSRLKAGVHPGGGHDHDVWPYVRILIVARCPLGSFHTGLQVRTFRRLSRRLPAAPEGLVKLYDAVEFVQSDL